MRTEPAGDGGDPTDATDATDAGGSIEAVRAIVRACRLLERASDELSLAHYRVLAAISSGEQRASRVARRLAVGKPTVSAAVDALVQRGLVERDIEAADNRASVLRLTSEGWEVLARVESAMVDRLTRLGELTDDPAGLVRGLVALGVALDGFRAAQTAGRTGSAL